MAIVPRATYRVQLTAQFGFDRVSDIADYLSGLGISHLYASPYLQAIEGSQHGYDVVDHGKINTELGGDAGHARMCRVLGENGLGQVLDIVPNHMAIGSPENVWWWDVLANGPSSRYASYFDVDWDMNQDNRVLLPILGEHYVDALESRLVKVERDGQRFLCRYHDHVLPAAPRSLEGLLRAAALADAEHGTAMRDSSPDPAADARGELLFLADALEALPAPSVYDHESVARRGRHLTAIFEYLRRLFDTHPELAQAVDTELARLSQDVEALDAWLERQNWRLAHWKHAATDLGYRRFFDVNTLAGMRMEDHRVFAASHKLILGWLSAGVLDGVRVDHPDGLRDPEEYLQKLRAAAPRAWIVVEKILHEGEQLPSNWPVAGTTGYDFMRLLDQVYVDPDGEGTLTELAARFAGGEQHWDEMARAAKLQILHDVLASECHRLVNVVHRLLVSRSSFRDCSWREVTAAVTELLASYATYRSYVRAGARVRSTDATLIAGAVATAARNQPEIEPRIWSALESALTLQSNSGEATEFALRLQQVTGAVAAKSIEDTLYYRYVRLLALNEVGGSPNTFGMSLSAFHQALEARAETQPAAMLGSTSHDTKRGEDVRARLLVLSELPDEWAKAVARWSARSQRYRGEPGSPPAVDGTTEYFFYQTLVGAYPLSPERAWTYMEKAIREAKLKTSWTRQDAGFEAAVAGFVHGVLSDAELMEDIAGFTRKIARPGYVKSLGRTLIKLTAPGVPDIYQGDELWDLSLVDPDNRRPVDFDARRALLARMPQMTPEQAMAELDAGTPKFYLSWKVLQLRKNRPELFDGEYAAVALDGPDETRAIAFRRGGGLVIAAPRLTTHALGGKPTALSLPDGEFLNVLTGERIPAGRGMVELGALWARFPVALLERVP
jgi:(1->4)-alpha-D-glucan 1-alpha-D-glucosylmutase